MASRWRKVAPPNESGRRDAPIDRHRARPQHPLDRRHGRHAVADPRTCGRASSPSSVGNSSSIPSSDACTSTGKPDSRKTLIIRRFSGSTVAVKVVTPRAEATCARWAISTVASPRPCISSATAKATSARSARSSSNTACATTRSSAPVVTISP